ncbi:metallophosphoesterase [Plantactinospora sp. KBS50]|uniref:metallophosphoesterase family protein n=1 Tax=Plantactinospora sp. KBS50 TaxID=2024580 RepID=UPI000BAACC27|nr:metallophosphoesterase [Plantactinospora sp. KBS50]ASW57368.1 metallophosphoesterase [Plantactinospora sp. KBS50]
MSDDAEYRRRRPRSLDPQELGYTRRARVPWLAPLLLVITGLRTLLALLFGAYLDKRELQGSLPHRIHRQETTDGELWFDYVADLGDGFDATYSIAYLLSRPELRIEGRPLPRGRMLVMGGDQVYPTASAAAYEDRCKGPYESALPLPPADAGTPELFAIPGNHDWYDGLTAFLRLFVRSRDDNIGGWCTPQTRSYFAIELPSGWWLLGLDGQSGSYLDDPQLTYFEQVARRLGPESRVILATPEPSWVKAVDHPEAYDSIDYFVRKLIAPTGARVALMLSGDLHHYARYTGPDRQLITCGGGGAYLYPTHHLPARIQVPPPDSRSRRASASRSYELAGRFPDAARSRRYAWGIFGRLPLRNPGFAALLGTLHTLLMLAMAGVAAHGTDGTEQRLFSVPLMGMLLVTMLGAAFFAKPPTAGGKRHVRHWILGVTHGLTHVGLAAAGTWAWLHLPFYQWEWPLPAVAAAVLYGPVSGFVASELVALYLLVAGAFGVNLNELFAGQGIEDSKGFLRLHIAADGSLTVYPLAVDRVCHHWRADPDGSPEAAWIFPEDPLAVRLAEPPISVR